MLRNNKQLRVYELIHEYYRGDAHIHSSHHNRITWNNWVKTFDADHIVATYAKLGFEFMVLVSHSSHPGKPHLIQADAPLGKFLIRKKKYVARKVARKQCRIMVGVEANIMYDETSHPVIDVADSILKQLDLVIASRHAIYDPKSKQVSRRLEKSPAEIQKTLLMATDHRAVHIIGHPDRYTRRDYARRESYWQEYWGMWPKVLNNMKRKHVAFEINISSPPAPELVEMAIKRGVVFFISSDAHRTTDFRYIELLRNECADVLAAETHAETVRRIRPAVRAWAKSHHLSIKTMKHSFDLVSQLLYWIYFLQERGVTSRRVVNSRYKRMEKFLRTCL